MRAHHHTLFCPSNVETTAVYRGLRGDWEGGREGIGGQEGEELSAYFVMNFL